MEFYSHQAQQPQQQQQQQSAQQQADSMASISSSTTTTNSNSATTIVGGASSSNNNNNNNIISSSTTPPTSSSANSTTSVVTADAATVAIAKDMLQLHHGGAAHNSSNMNATSSIIAASASSSSSSPSPSASATTTNTTSPPAHASNAAAGLLSPPENALGYLKYDQDLLYITESCTIIGRNSSTSHVHFHVAENNLVSRKHFQVHYDADTRDFYVQCLSKNGIFVDDFLQRRNADPLKLPASCFFRFPSTEIRIQFESFLHASSSNAVSSSSSGALLNNSHNALAMHHNNASGASTNAGMIGNSAGSSSGTHVIISAAPTDESHLHHHHQQQQQHALSSSSMSGTSHLVPMDSTNVIYSPLKITIPKKEQKSPYLSPTGTISAANSCPASPRQGYYQNQANNYGSNNLQSEDLFQPPSQSEKPPYSYAQLIVQAISAAPDKQLTLSGIYSFIVKHYPYYRKEINKGWQNSIRHNLSLNRYFIKVARSQDEPGKGSFWRIDPDSGAKLIDHSYKKRRQRSSQGFRPSYGMPRSAPVSPSHMDNSRESSPVQDIVLQSAPGSPGMSMENRTVEDLMYNSQNIQLTSANNSHNQYNSGSPYYISNQNSIVEQQHTVGGGGGNGVGALIALKRNHAMAANAAMGHQQQQQQTQQQQSLHPDIIYEDMPTDYSGNMESGDECDGAAAPKRSKYISEVL